MKVVKGVVDTFERDESALHYAPTWVIMTMPIAVIGLVISGIITLVSLIRGGISVVSLIVFALCLVWGIFSDIYFDYYEGCKISFNPNCFVVEYNLNSSVIASSSKKVRIDVRNVKKLKVKGKKAVVWGDITKATPFKNGEKLKKIEIPINFKEQDVVVGKIKECIGG